VTTTKSLTNVTVKDADKGLVEAVISTFGVIDADGDVTSKSTFTDGAEVVVSAYGHTSWDGSLPLGKGTLSTTDTEAIASLQFFMDTPHGLATFNTIKGLGPLQEWSYSLENTVAKMGELDGRAARFIDSTYVKEVSPVLRGASIGTRTLAIKGAGLTFSEHAEAVLTAADELIARASEVVTLRATQGKTIGAESAELMTRLDGSLDRLKALLAEPTPVPPVDDEVTQLWLRSVANLQGVTTP
jgi:hypothetical protein